MEQSQDELEEYITQRLIKQVEVEEGVDMDSDATDSNETTQGREVGDLPNEESTNTDVGIIAAPADELAESAAELTPTETASLTPTAFTKVEKSLAALGFFTPSSRRLKEQKVKQLSFTRLADGKRVEATAQIVPSALFGLPITADQDKYLALQQLITNILLTQGEVKNPIRFKTADLLRILNRNTKAGKNYKEVGEWLSVMTATTIISKGAVFHAGRKSAVTDRLHVFDRAVTVGTELDDGTIADANYVWLSPWQLANINNKYLLPIDLDTYRELKNHIAKALVPLLQIWLYATQKSGSFEKRYDELCEILNLQTYRAPSQILRQLKPSLDELTRFEYIEKWRIEKTADRKSCKIIFFHGAKFHRDRRRRLEQKTQSQPPVLIAEYDPDEESLPQHGKLEAPSTSVPTRTHRNNAELLDSSSNVGDQSHSVQKSIPTQPPAVSQSTFEDFVQSPVTETVSTALSGNTAVPVVPQLVSEYPLTDDEREVMQQLVERGVMQSAAIDLIRSISLGHLDDVRDQIDWWDSIRPDRERGKGAGLLIHLIKKNDPVPPSFETSRRRTKRLAAEDRREKLQFLKTAIENEYEEYRQLVVDRFIIDEVTPEEFERRVQTHAEALSKQSGLWTRTLSPERLDHLARGSVRSEIAKEVSILSFDDYRQRELPRILAEHHLDPETLGITLPVLSTDPTIV